MNPNSKWLVYGGISALVAWAILRSNKAQAGVAPIGSPATVSNTPGNRGTIDVYTPAALDASTPGVSFTPSTLQPGILTSTLTGVPAVTGTQVAQASSFWDTLSPVAALDSGYITFPSGSQVAAAAMTAGNTRMDGNGNYYVLWGTQVYQLGSQDSSGNWPTLLVGS